MHKIILASASPARIEMLAALGIYNPVIEPADINEDQRCNETPKNLSARLAKEKAEKIASYYSSGELIIAGDSVVCAGARILPKATTDELVRSSLNILSGRRHRVYSSVCIIDSKTQVARCKTALSTMKIRRLSQREIEEYVKTGEGLNKAGGYAIQGRIQAFVPFISGQVSTVIGLPLFETRNILSSFNYKFDE